MSHLSWWTYSPPVYDEMVDAKIAIELVVHTSTDQYGNTVDEEDQFGMKQNI